MKEKLTNSTDIQTLLPQVVIFLFKILGKEEEQGKNNIKCDCDRSMCGSCPFELYCGMKNSTTYETWKELIQATNVRLLLLIMQERFNLSSADIQTLLPQVNALLFKLLDKEKIKQVQISQELTHM